MIAAGNSVNRQGQMKSTSKARKGVRVTASKKPVVARAPLRPAPVASVDSGWNFLSNHGHVLVCLARNPDMRLRDVAQAVGITERAVQKIIGDLEQGAVLTRERDGRRNKYQLHVDQPMRHPLEAHRSVATLLRSILLASELKQLEL